MMCNVNHISSIKLLTAALKVYKITETNNLNK